VPFFSLQRIWVHLGATRQSVTNCPVAHQHPLRIRLLHFMPGTVRFSCFENLLYQVEPFVKPSSSLCRGIPSLPTLVPCFRTLRSSACLLSLVLDHALQTRHGSVIWFLSSAWPAFCKPRHGSAIWLPSSAWPAFCKPRHVSVTWLLASPRWPDRPPPPAASRHEFITTAFLALPNMTSFTIPRFFFTSRHVARPPPSSTPGPATQPHRQESNHGPGEDKPLSATALLCVPPDGVQPTPSLRDIGSLGSSSLACFGPAPLVHRPSRRTWAHGS